MEHEAGACVVGAVARSHSQKRGPARFDTLNREYIAIQACRDDGVLTCRLNARGRAERKRNLSGDFRLSVSRGGAQQSSDDGDSRPVQSACPFDGDLLLVSYFFWLFSFRYEP